MTHEEAYTEAADPAHKDPAKTTDADILKRATVSALAELSRSRVWWFCEIEIAFVPVAGTRQYSDPARAWSAANKTVTGDYVTIASYDAQSFRCNSQNRIPFIEHEVIDADDPDWTYTSETGLVDRWTSSNAKVNFYKTPSAAFEADNPFIWGSAYRMLKVPKDTPSATADEVEWTDEIPLVPRHWHQVVVDGIVYHTFRQTRAPGWDKHREVFRESIKEMGKGSVQYHGQTSDQLVPAGPFLKGRRFIPTAIGGSDYGRFSY